ncbi:hypothetical protein BDB01DRAFT_849667 [Pilobolus umbonatus]|nr:hypothetical protein BDB01DRAFT_849667 [Pilobolus umbonatus]
MDSQYSIVLDKPYFLLEEGQSHAYSNIYGVIQMNSVYLQPPEWIDVQLIGTEIIGKKSQIIVNDIYRISNHDIEWTIDQDNDFQYNFPFNIPIESENVPSSFQMMDPNKQYSILGGIFYTLQVITPNQKITRPIHLYRSHVSAPRRVFWGISNKLKWQYELEFPQIFDITSNRSGLISIRLRSTCYRNTSESCLIGCQLIQSVHLEGSENQHQLLMTHTHLLITPNTSWKQPCQIEFDLDDTVLPTVISHRIGVTHSIRITFAFSNLLERTNHSMEFTFPVRIGGVEERIDYYSSSKDVTVSRSSSTSSRGTDIMSLDSAIDLTSFKAN